MAPRQLLSPSDNGTPPTTAVAIEHYAEEAPARKTGDA